MITRRSGRGGRGIRGPLLTVAERFRKDDLRRPPCIDCGTAW